MDILQGFVEKDMIEQITILEEIKEAGEHTVLPGLMDIYAESNLDQAVEEMVYHALYDLLADYDEVICSGLNHNSSSVQLLCIRRAGEDGRPATLPTLKALLANSSDAVVVSEVLRALGGFSDDSSIVDNIIPYLKHEDDAVVAWAMHSLVALGGVRSRKALMDTICENAESVQTSGICELKTAQAISSLVKFKDEEAVDFLIAFIHHPTPSFRKVVINALGSLGEISLPALEKCLSTGNKDEKIMAVNVIGWTHQKKGAEILNTLLDERDDIDINLKFAVYEALGRIPSVRSFIGLVDGLVETDEMLLMAVVTGLDVLSNPGIVKTLNTFIAKDDEQSKRILQTMITSRSVNLFKGLYQEGSYASALINSIVASTDQEEVLIFRDVLAGIDGEQAAADYKRLAAVDASVKAWRVVAADDSKAMLFFYKGAAADMGIDLLTFADGKDALEYLKGDGLSDEIDLLITDMNMPEMDGVELTRELRAMTQWANMPILMATTETEKEQAEQARQAGVSYFISKPFSKDILKAKLNEILQ